MPASSRVDRWGTPTTYPGARRSRGLLARRVDRYLRSGRRYGCRPASLHNAPVNGEPPGDANSCCPSRARRAMTGRAPGSLVPVVATLRQARDPVRRAVAVAPAGTRRERRPGVHFGRGPRAGRPTVVLGTDVRARGSRARPPTRRRCRPLDRLRSLSPVQKGTLLRAERPRRPNRSWDRLPVVVVPGPTRRPRRVPRPRAPRVPL